MRPERRTDIDFVVVQYKDGTVDRFGRHMDEGGFHGHIRKYVNHDAKPGTGREEWDELEIQLVGEKRMLRVPPE